MLLVTARAVIYVLVVSILVLASLHAVAGYTTFASIPAFCWRPYCGGGPFVAFTPAVACIHAVVGGRAIPVILAVASCWRHSCCLRQLINCE